MLEKLKKTYESCLISWVGTVNCKKIGIYWVDLSWLMIIINAVVNYLLVLLVKTLLLVLWQNCCEKFGQRNRKKLFNIFSITEISIQQISNIWWNSPQIVFVIINTNIGQFGGYKREKSLYMSAFTSTYKMSSCEIT